MAAVSSPAVSDPAVSGPIITAISKIDGKYIGYEVNMNDGRIILLKIRDISMCCEQYDCEITESSYNYIGSEFISVSSWSVKASEERMEQHMKIATRAGDIRIMCYNRHNGYYPHEVVAQFIGGNIHEQCREIPCDDGCSSCNEIEEFSDQF